METYQLYIYAHVNTHSHTRHKHTLGHQWLLYGSHTVYRPAFTISWGSINIHWRVSQPAYSEIICTCLHENMLRKKTKKWESSWWRDLRHLRAAAWLDDSLSVLFVEKLHFTSWKKLKQIHEIMYNAQHLKGLCLISGYYTVCWDEARLRLCEVCSHLTPIHPSGVCEEIWISGVWTANKSLMIPSRYILKYEKHSAFDNKLWQNCLLVCIHQFAQLSK